MAADEKDGLIDLEDLMREIDGPKAQSTLAPTSEAESKPQESRLAATPTPSQAAPLASSEILQAAPQTAPEESGSLAQKTAVAPIEPLAASPVKAVKTKSDANENKGEPGASPEATSVQAEVDKTRADGKLSDQEFDSILLSESPELAAEMSGIREVANADLPNNQSSEAIDDELKLVETLGFAARVRRRIDILLLKFVGSFAAIKTFCFRLVKDSRGLLVETLGNLKSSLRTSFLIRKEQLKSGLKWFQSRTLKQKLAAMGATIMSILAAAIVYKMMNQSLLPDTKREWVASLAELADGVFQFEANEPMEDFNDPILHPEFAVSLERIVVNLKRSADASSGNSSALPMAALEFLLQADSQLTAIELKDRDVEVRDQVARVIEQFSYPELATEEGKARLKLVIRKRLNEILTKGRIRRVYFNKIVLNPE